MEYNNEDYPRLTPPAVVYEGKAALKKPAIVPLWVKVSAAAASVVLLVALFFRQPARPELELMAELSPVKAVEMEAEQPLSLNGQRAHFTAVLPAAKKKNSDKQPVAPVLSEEASRDNLILLASLPSRPATSLSQVVDVTPLMIDDPLWDLALVEYEPADDDDELSIARKGFQKMTEGRFDSFGEMLSYGWRSVKDELAQLNESVSEGISSVKQREW